MRVQLTEPTLLLHSMLSKGKTGRVPIHQTISVDPNTTETSPTRNSSPRHSFSSSVLRLHKSTCIMHGLATSRRRFLQVRNSVPWIHWLQCKLQLEASSNLSPTQRHCLQM